MAADGGLLLQPFHRGDTDTMTDRTQTLTVALDRDYRGDDVERIVEAIGMVRGVAAVTTEVVDHNDYGNRQMIAMKWRTTIFEVFMALCDDRKITVEEK